MRSPIPRQPVTNRPSCLQAVIPRRGALRNRFSWFPLSFQALSTQNPLINSFRDIPHLWGYSDDHHLRCTAGAIEINCSPPLSHPKPLPQACSLLRPLLWLSHTPGDCLTDNSPAIPLTCQECRQGGFQTFPLSPRLQGHSQPFPLQAGGSQAGCCLSMLAACRMLASSPDGYQRGRQKQLRTFLLGASPV